MAIENQQDIGANKYKVAYSSLPVCSKLASKYFFVIWWNMAQQTKFKSSTALMVRLFWKNLN